MKEKRNKNKRGVKETRQEEKGKRGRKREGHRTQIIGKGRRGRRGNLRRTKGQRVTGRGTQHFFLLLSNNRD